jgi:hypothetical protein
MLDKSKMPRMIPIPFANGESHRKWMLTEEWLFHGWDDCAILIEKDFIFNGASIPKVFSNVFASTGILFLAALIHDHLYQYRWMWIIENCDSERKKFYVSRDLADVIFGEIALISYPNNRKSIWLAKTLLSAGGSSAWNACRKIEGNYVPPKPPDGFDENYATKEHWDG